MNLTLFSRSHKVLAQIFCWDIDWFDLDDHGPLFKVKLGFRKLINGFSAPYYHMCLGYVTDIFSFEKYHLMKGKNSFLHITNTCLYKFDLLQPHFYIVKLGFTGVYVIFLILPNNIDCGYSLEPPRRGGSNEFPQSMFWAEIWKISGILSDFFSVFGGEISFIFE